MDSNCCFGVAAAAAGGHGFATGGFPSAAAGGLFAAEVEGDLRQMMKAAVAAAAEAFVVDDSGN